LTRDARTHEHDIDSGEHRAVKCGHHGALAFFQQIETFFSIVFLFG
jgi:hypothetical protein